MYENTSQHTKADAGRCGPCPRTLSGVCSQLPGDRFAIVRGHGIPFRNRSSGRGGAHDFPNSAFRARLSRGGTGSNWFLHFTLYSFFPTDEEVINRDAAPSMKSVVQPAPDLRLRLKMIAPTIAADGLISILTVCKSQRSF